MAGLCSEIGEHIMAKLTLNYDKPGDEDGGRTESFDTLIRKVDQMFAELYEASAVLETNVAAGSAISLTTSVAANIGFVDLTAGDWDVIAQATYTTAASTVVSFMYASLSPVSATLAPTSADTYAIVYNAATGITPNVANLTCGPVTKRVTVAPGTTTRLYLVAFAGFQTSTLTAHGFIRARRMR